MVDPSRAQSERRERVINLLVDEAVTKAIDSGVILGNELAFRAKKREQIEAQERRHPNWLAKQSARFFGDVRRPTSLPTCPNCGITFNATPTPNLAAPREPVDRLHPCWTNGHVNVAVPEGMEKFYASKGYKRMEPQPEPVVIPEADDEPVRGPDGLDYCRRSCALGAQSASFADSLRAHPEWADQLAFVANVLERRGLGGGTIGLSSIAPAPTFEDVAF